MVTDSRLALLRDHLFSDPRYGGSEPDGLAPTHVLLALLCAVPRIPNPDPPPLVLAPLDALAIMSCVAPERLREIPSSLVTEINRAIAAGERETMARWGAFCLACSRITSDELGAIMELLAATVDDPDHPAELDAGPAPLQELWGYEAGVSRGDVNSALGRDAE